MILSFDSIADIGHTCGDVHEMIFDMVEIDNCRSLRKVVAMNCGKIADIPGIGLVQPGRVMEYLLISGRIH